MYKPVNPKIVLRETKNNLTEVYKIGGKALTLSWAIKGKACYFWLFLLFPAFYLIIANGMLSWQTITLFYRTDID